MDIINVPILFIKNQIYYTISIYNNKDFYQILIFHCIK